MNAADDPSKALDLVTLTEEVKPYRQFTDLGHKHFLNVLCPECDKYFGLPAEEVDSRGEAGYLLPYSCPYCHEQFTLKSP